MIKRKGQKFCYVYDFGDCWEHSLLVEKVFEDESLGTICIGGERKCPPEDCGGVRGYYDLVNISKDKSHQEYEERIVEWLGEGFDFEFFDLESINEALF